MSNSTTHLTHEPGTSTGGRLGLRLNALLSFATGSLFTIAPATVGGWLGVSIDGWLRLFGVALLGHAAVLAWAGSRDTIVGWLTLNLATIAPYPLLMIGLVVSGLVERPLGQALVLIDGALVATVAVVQARGRARARTSGNAADTLEPAGLAT